MLADTSLFTPACEVSAIGRGAARAGRALQNVRGSRHPSTQGEDERARRLTARHCAASDAMLARRCNISRATGPSPGRHRSSRTMGGVNEPRRTWLEMNSDMSTTFRRSTLPPQSESTPGTVVSILADGCSCVPKKHRKPLVASVSGLS